MGHLFSRVLDASQIELRVSDDPGLDNVERLRVRAGVEVAHKDNHVLVVGGLRDDLGTDLRATVFWVALLV